MNLRTRLKKLEATRRPVHVVDSWDDQRAACVAFGVYKPTLNDFLPLGEGPRPDRPPTYQELREAGVIVETERYVASLQREAEEAGMSVLDLEVRNWQAIVGHNPEGAYVRARPIRGL